MHCRVVNADVLSMTNDSNYDTGTKTALSQEKVHFSEQARQNHGQNEWLHWLSKLHKAIKMYICTNGYFNCFVICSRMRRLLLFYKHE